jgi:hypothetical protein
MLFMFVLIIDIVQLLVTNNDDTFVLTVKNKIIWAVTKDDT